MPMFLVVLEFAANQALAGTWMDGHKRWLQRGFDDGVFLLAGSLAAQRGGAVLAHGVSRQALQSRVDEDPFVSEQVVRAEIVEFTPSRLDPRLSFLA